jgi:hypothetical protein
MSHALGKRVPLLTFLEPCTFTPIIGTHARVGYEIIAPIIEPIFPESKARHTQVGLQEVFHRIFCKWIWLVSEHFVSDSVDNAPH